jgi:hypothetical protein
MKAIFCIGASHIMALRDGYSVRAAARMAGGFAWKEIATPRHMKAHRHVITEAIDAEYAAIVSTADVSEIFLCCGGGEHVGISLFNNRPFEVYMPDDDPQQEISRDCDIIPYDVLLATCAFHVLEPVPFVQRIRSLSSLPMYHILPPPPPAAEECARDRVPPVFRDLIDKFGITPAPLRHKVWHICCTAARQTYQDMGISVIEPPAEALDERGFLAPQYAGADLVHANEAYGALVVDRMVSIAANHAPRASA